MTCDIGHPNGPLHFSITGLGRAHDPKGPCDSLRFLLRCLSEGLSLFLLDLNLASCDHKELRVLS